ncbi:MAG: hypothetical protein R2715_19435 [Ilumatobacteraceae bacterium]
MNLSKQLVLGPQRRGPVGLPRSTGNGKNYDEEQGDPGAREIGVAITRPVQGTAVDQPRYEGCLLGTLYRPRFFSGGSPSTAPATSRTIRPRTAASES